MLVDEKPEILFRALSTQWWVDLELYWLAPAAWKRTVGIAARGWPFQFSSNLWWLLSRIVCVYRQGM